MKKLFRKLQEKKLENESTVENPSIESKEMIENNDDSIRGVEIKNEEVREKPSVDLESEAAIHNKNINLKDSKRSDNHIEKDYGGLDGNPGQRARFNHMMENKGGNLNKYFWSGKR